MFKILILTTFLFLSLVYPTFGQLGLSKFKEGETAFKNGRYEEAIKLYSEAIAVEDKQYRYHQRKGQAYLKLNKYDDALKSFQEATRLNSGYTAGYVYMSKIHVRKKEYDKAVELMNTAFEKETDVDKKLSYKLQVVKLYNVMGKPQDAQRELQAAKSIDEKDIRVMEVDGDVNGELGQWQPALESYQKAYEKAKASGLSSSELGKYYYKVGVANYKLGNMNKYQEIQQSLNSSSPNYARRLRNTIKGSTGTRLLKVAMGYIEASDYEEATKYINKAIEQKENEALGHKMLGNCYAKTGQFSQAISSLAKSIETEKDEVKKDKVRKTLLKLQFTNKDYNGALTTAQQIIDKNPNDLNARLSLAKANYLLSNYDKAIAACDEVIGKSSEKDDRRAAAYFIKGLAAKKSSKTDMAKEAFTKAQGSKSFRSAALEEIKSLSAR